MRAEGKGARTARTSIASKDDLKARCRCVDDCWIWQGYKDAHGRIRLRFERSVVTINTLIRFLRTGKRDGKAIWVSGCLTTDCCNPEHWQASNRSAITRKTMAVAQPLRVLKITTTRRAQSRLTDEAIVDIQTSQESLKSLRERHGISYAQAQRIRTGKCWAPVKKLVTSVFDFAESL
jgi:hypothetical protein